MKLRHAAAFGLLMCFGLQACSESGDKPGWYRMLPPIVDDQPNTAAPLPQWLISPPKPYASEAECTSDLSPREKKAVAEQRPAGFLLWPGVSGNQRLLVEQENAARCAYSDHPQFPKLVRLDPLERESIEREKDPGKFGLPLGN